MRISDWSSDVCSSDLPTQRIFSGKVSNLRVYGSVTNLFTITGYSGMDPEVSQYSSDFTAPGVDMGVYPRSEERRGGKECVSTCRSRCSAYLYKKQLYRDNCK